MPGAPENFVTGGYSYEALGRSLLYNDYVVVGPPSDPAGVKTNDPNNGVGAFNAIASEGHAHSDATFVSRNDASGTNVQEETMWGQTGRGDLQTAQNAGGVAGLFQPAASSGSTSYPSWYVRQTATSEQGQAANLVSTATCAVAFAPDGGCYTMTDRGTLAYIQSQGQATGLTILAQNNAAGATGGVTELINPFHAYIVTPIDPKPGSGGIYPSGLVPNVTAATRFVNFLTGATGASASTGHMTYTPEFQNELSTYLAPAGMTPIFHPDAFPQVIQPNPAPTGSPHSVAHGSAQPVSATLIYAPSSLAGGSPIKSIPYTVNMSTNGGTTWTTVGSGSTNAAGHVSVTATMPATVGTTVSLQISTPVYNDLADPSFATQFSPHEDSVDLGTFKTT
jgi:ABC-type tungstate transport system permease subunit